MSVEENVGPAEAAVAPVALGLKAQLLRFVLIGGVAACVDLGIYQLLLALGVWAPLAKGVSFILGTTTAYLLNRRFTFAASAGGGAKFVGFLVLYGSTFAVNVGVASLVLHLADAPTVNPPLFASVLSWFVAQACATTINFVVMKWVLFRS
ncbi:GtrA family protein [Actinomycetospora sp. NBRC 106378]|uniref:GtrA family protein n=1 Tax=Actinomycetospora sp. NBRC 106378 TaxID=3032208 RepID=UPI002553B306|nr:GtrA family protein [Actinomycetospora sp. NBRC 106378]